MPLQATSGAASYDAFGGGVAAVPNYIEDVFSTYLYTGNKPSTQTVTNGIDLSGKGGMVWVKNRASATFPNNTVFDTARGAGAGLITNSTAAQDTSYTQSFSSTGFDLGGDNGTNQSGITYVSWTFRKQPKFFDVVTYTGNGSNQTISHSLGSAPGCIIVKRLDAVSNWRVYHRSLSLPNESWMHLNTTDASFTSGGTNIWNVTSSSFQADTYLGLSTAGATYVAYLFAHNAGGFGLTGTDNVISCGSYTGVGGGNVATITLGYEPQWILVKRTDNSAGGNWAIFDNMRGMSVNSTDNASMLNPNVSDFESVLSAFKPTATGFQTGDNFTASGGTYIYIAIRRGPMKVPTSGTSVFAPATRTGNGAITSLTAAGFPPDLYWAKSTAAVRNHAIFDRLRGPLPLLSSNSTQNEIAYTDDLKSFDMTGVTTGTDGSTNAYNQNGVAYVNWYMRRAPSFFDEVCYTGTGANRTVTHNLGVVPEMMIVKSRSGTGDWWVYNKSLGSGSPQTKALFLNFTEAELTVGVWNNTAPTSSVFSVSSSSAANGSGLTYVAYLFATCAGVSKCTAFTGTGTLQTINCGFTAGSRFVLIKRTDAAGDWYVWDSSRGLSSSTDPYLLLNSTAAEVTSTNWVDTTSTGFQVTAASGNNVNINGASYIALAIA